MTAQQFNRSTDMTDAAKKALKELADLKWLTTTTGQNTNRAQRLVIRSISPADLAEVATAFRELNEMGHNVSLTAEERADLERGE